MPSIQQLRLKLILTVSFLAISLTASSLAKNRPGIGTEHARFDPLTKDYYASIAAQKNTNIINIQFKNPGLINTQDFLFELENQAGQQVAKIPFSGRNVGDPTNLRFQFAPYPGQDQLTLHVSPLSSPTPPYVNVSITKNSTLAYSTFTRTDSVFSQYLSDLTFFINKLSKDPLFLIIWLIAIIYL